MGYYKRQYDATKQMSQIQVHNHDIGTATHVPFPDVSCSRSCHSTQGLNHSPGGKQQRIRDHSRDKRRRKEREVAGEVEEEGEREIDNPKAAAVSKHQQKKTRRKKVGASVVRFSLLCDHVSLALPVPFRKGIESQ